MTPRLHSVTHLECAQCQATYPTDFRTGPRVYSPCCNALLIRVVDEIPPPPVMPPNRVMREGQEVGPQVGGDPIWPFSDNLSVALCMMVLTWVGFLAGFFARGGCP